MLFGNVIFIKKTGADGSKYPVTERSIKIGRSDECLIRIQNAQVALEHCQLIIDDNGQAKLRNLANLIILNDKPLSQGEVTLCHGDIFKLGERLARWEYLPSSKYYRQLLSPTGRLVAVVIPQQRSMEDYQIPGTSQSSVSKSTPVFGKRRLMERSSSEGGSTKKKSRISNVTKTQRSTGNVTKLLSARRSLHTPKIILTPKIKQRKSMSSVLSSKTVPVTHSSGKYGKSTLPSWKLNSISQSSRKSVQRTSTPIKKPLLMKSSEKILKSGGKSAVKTSNLKTIAESPLKEKTVSKLRSRSLSKSPPATKSLKMSNSVLLPSVEKGSNLKAERLIKSEKKSNSKSSYTGKEYKRVSVILKNIDKTPRRSVLNGTSGESPERLTSPNVCKEKSYGHGTSRMFNSTVLLHAIQMTPERSDVDKTGSVKKMRTPKSSSVKLSSVTLPLTSPSRGRGRPRKTSLAYSPKTSPKNQPADKTKLSSTKKKKSVTKKSDSTVKSPTPKKISATKGHKSSSQLNAPEENPTSSKGVRRKLSLSISSEKAAKKLKISSPRKPDKNKKAALLVLGKANRKQSLSQNVKVLLKQRIVKKAIKQSTMIPGRKDEHIKKATIKALKNNKRAPVKKVALLKKKVSEKKTSLQKRGASQVPKSEVPVIQNMPRSSTNIKTQEGEEGTSKGKKGSGEKSPNRSNISQNEISPSKALDSEEAKSPTKQNKKWSSSLFDVTAGSGSFGKTTPVGGFEGSESFIFTSNRRCSKRLSSKNDSGRPDYMELSPTALGLMPKNIGSIFKTPKEKKRRSSSLTTPKNAQSAGIIKSASTSKIGNHKSVRFSSKDISITSPYSSLNNTQGTNFDFESVQTPNITMDMFVSPLSERSYSSFSVDVNGTTRMLTFAEEEEGNSKAKSTSPTKLKSPGTLCKPTKSALKTPTPQKSPKKLVSGEKRVRSSLKELNEAKNVSSPKIFERADNEISFNFDSSSNLKIPISPVKIAGPKSPKSSPARKISTTAPSLKSPPRTPTRKSPKGIPRLKTSTASSVSKSPKTVKSSPALRTPHLAKSTRSSLASKSPVTPQSIKSSRNSGTPKSSGSSKKSPTSKTTRSPRAQIVSPTSLKAIKTPTKKSPESSRSTLAGTIKSPRGSSSQKTSANQTPKASASLKSPKAIKTPVGSTKTFTNPEGLKIDDSFNNSTISLTTRTPKSDLKYANNVQNITTALEGTQSLKTYVEKISTFTAQRNSMHEGSRRLGRPRKDNRSPKNDLTDVGGLRKLFQTPTTQKGPKNDLSDVRGVRELLGSPRAQKSPKNDLTDVRGVRQLMQTPKVQNTPKNDLTDVAGVRQLLKTPRTQKSPKNDLSDLRGVRQLLQSPRPQKSPKNDLSDLRGVRQLLQSPRPQKSPRNDLTDVSGVRKLMTTPRLQKSPKNDLTDVTGIGEFFESPKVLQTPKNEMEGTGQLFKTPQSVRNSKEIDVAGVKQLLITKSSASVSNTIVGRKSVSDKSELNDFRSIRGRRTIYSTSKSPKNDLTDVGGVRELFSRNTKTTDLNISLTGVAQLFDFPAHGVEITKQQQEEAKLMRRKVTIESRSTNTTRSAKESEISALKSYSEVVTRGSRSRKAATEVGQRITRRYKEEPPVKQTAKEKLIKRKAAETRDTAKVKKSVRTIKKLKEAIVEETKTRRSKAQRKVTFEESEIKGIVSSSRKRKAVPTNVESSPPKLRRRQAKSESATQETTKKGTRRSTISRSGTDTKPEENTPVVRMKASTTAKTTKVPYTKVQIKTTKTTKTAAIKPSEKSTPKVQRGRSQAKSDEKESHRGESVSPRKTRNAKATTVQEIKPKVQTKTVKSRVVKTTVGRKRVSPAVKRSTRRK